MFYYDAHNHLHDARLDSIRDEAISRLTSCGLNGAIVNGTREQDWPAVARLAAGVSWVRASFGLHPWHVPLRSAEWKEKLLAALEECPGAAIGEIGLDRWVEGHNIAEQTECFEWQLALAAKRNLPASIHCVQAWGAMWASLKRTPLPACGYLLHAYGGAAEMVPGFARLGAYFSFSPYYLHERKSAQREAFAVIPMDRLLVETDAPDLSPPAEKNPHPLPGGINHPLNLFMCYEALAALRGVSVEALAEQVEANFKRLFSQTNLQERS